MGTRAGNFQPTYTNTNESMDYLEHPDPRKRFLRDSRTSASSQLPARQRQRTHFGLALGLGLFLCLIPSACSRKPPAKPNVVSSSNATQEGTTEANSTIDETRDEPALATTKPETHADAPGNDRLEADSAPSEVPVDADSAAPEWTSQGSWTDRRLVALAATGPTILDFSVQVGVLDLDEASTAILQNIADELFDDLEKPVRWSALVEHPLVQSGWLGNLVPEEEQVDQLIAMYDDQADGQVTLEELGLFLSRGLSRNSPLQFSDIGMAPGASPSQSPWGPLDRNQDYSLDAAELEQAKEALTQYDFNGDSILSQMELDRSRGTQPQNNSMNSMGGSMLDTNSLLEAPRATEELDDQQRQLRRFSAALLDRYTFAIGIPREQWTSWSDEAWQRIDQNEDGNLNREELEAVATLPSHAHILLHFTQFNAPEKETQENSFQMTATTASTEKSSEGWVAATTGGRFESPGFLAIFEIQDAYTSDAKTLLRQRLESALKDPQLQAFFRNQLQLKDGAFELIDSDENGELEEQEFERVWNWLSSRQASRMIVRWMLADRPWFVLLDQNADQRLTAIELAEGPKQLLRFDSNQDGELTPNELPLLVRVELDRSDSRLELSRLLRPNDEADQPDVLLDWFVAMDTNLDGYLDKDEFLGDSGEFKSRDADEDGFLSRGEVYEP